MLPASTQGGAAAGAARAPQATTTPSPDAAAPPPPDEDAGQAWRCFKSGHGVSCRRCVPPPPDCDVDACWMLRVMLLAPRTLLPSSSTLAVMGSTVARFFQSYRFFFV